MTEGEDKNKDGNIDEQHPVDLDDDSGSSISCESNDTSVLMMKQMVGALLYPLKHIEKQQPLESGVQGRGTKWCKTADQNRNQNCTTHLNLVCS